jgi:exosortase K
VSSLERAAARALKFWRASGGAVSALALVAAFGLKLAYSRASVSELEWILGPSCWLASLAGIPLEHEQGAGWISHATHMIVGPACAGVNFMVVCWLALYFARQAELQAARRRSIWLAASGCIAYAAAIFTNGVRVVLAAELYEHSIAIGWLSPERLHRLLGVVLYCSVLFALCRAVGAKSSRLSAFAWYLGVVLGIPLLNQAFTQRPAAFAEHAVSTLGIGALVLLLFSIITPKPRRRLSEAPVGRFCDQSSASYSALGAEHTWRNRGS